LEDDRAFFDFENKENKNSVAINFKIIEGKRNISIPLQKDRIVN